MGNIDHYKALHTAFNDRNWSALEAGLASGFTFVDNARGMTLTSPKAFVDWAKEWVAAFSNGKLDVAGNRYIEAGDAVFCLGTYSGTNDGSFGSYGSTGRKVTERFCEPLSCLE